MKYKFLLKKAGMVAHRVRQVIGELQVMVKYLLGAFQQSRPLRWQDFPCPWTMSWHYATELHTLCLTQLIIDNLSEMCPLTLISVTWCSPALPYIFDRLATVLVSGAMNKKMAKTFQQFLAVAKQNLNFVKAKTIFGRILRKSKQEDKNIAIKLSLWKGPKSPLQTGKSF